jgi:hypothetical protein
MVGQAVSFMVDIYVECYVHGYPPPRISWYAARRRAPVVERRLSSVCSRYKNDYGGQVSSMISVDVLRPIWNSYKYKIEATIPEPNICTDCILSRLTIINVEASDLGSYVINATTNDKPYRTAIDSVFVYGMTVDPLLAVSFTRRASVAFRDARLPTVHHASRQHRL